MDYISLLKMKHVVTTKNNDIEITKHYFVSRCLKYVKNFILGLLSKISKNEYTCRKKQKLIKYKIAL